MGSFLGLQLSSIGLLVWLYSSIMQIFHNCSGVQLWVSMVIPLEVLLLLRRAFAILGFLLFQMNLQIALSNSLKNWFGILMVIALNLYIAFGKIAIFTIMILPIHEHGRSFHLLRSSLNSFFRDLKFLLYRSFTSLESHQDIFYHLWLLRMVLFP